MAHEDGVDLQLPESKINRNHAMITQADGVFWIEDLMSRNGTFLNHEPVYSGTRLNDGDEIQVGSYSLLFSVEIKSTPKKMKG